MALSVVYLCICVYLLLLLRCGATNVVNKHILTAQQDVADARTANYGIA